MVFRIYLGRRVDRQKYHIQIPLPPKIDPSVTMMTVEEKPDVTYSDIGGCKEQIERMREVSAKCKQSRQCSCVYECLRSNALKMK